MPPASESLDVLRIATTRLTEAGFVYMLTGPLALLAYGEPRETEEFDLVVRIRATDVEWIAALFSRDFDLDIAAVERAAAEQGVASLAHRQSGVRVRCHALPAEGYYRQAFDRRWSVPIQDVPVSVAASEDLLLWFLHHPSAGVERVALDHARALLARVPGMDERYLEGWATELGVLDRLHAVRYG